MHYKGLGKDRVFFLFRVSEHRDYVAQLRTPPKEVTFKAA